MTKKNDGGSAFPLLHSKVDFDPGMSLRDYFATKADIPWNATIRAFHDKEKSKKDPTLQDFFELRSRLKYIEADAMIKERNLSI